MKLYFLFEHVDLKEIREQYFMHKLMYVLSEHGKSIMN